MRNVIGDRKDGLTLMELMVVMAIIVILAALLLPAISGVKAKAHQVKCMSNLDQIGTNLRMYVTDIGEFPLAEQSVNKGSTRILSWEAYLMGSHPTTNVIVRTPESGQVFDCPGASMPRIFERHIGGYTDYGYNKYGAGGDELPFLGLGGKGNRNADNFIDKLPPAVKAGAVKAPSRMFAVGGGMIGCGQRIKDGVGWISRWNIIPETRGDTVSRLVMEDGWSRMRERHGGRINVVHVDGHTEAVPLEIMMVSKDPADVSRWNRDNKPRLSRLCQ